MKTSILALESKRILRSFDGLFFKRNEFLPKLYMTFGSEMPLLLSKRRGCFFKICPRTLIYTLVVTKLSRFPLLPIASMMLWEMPSKPKYRALPQNFSWGLGPQNPSFYFPCLIFPCYTAAQSSRNSPVHFLGKKFIHI